MRHAGHVAVAWLTALAFCAALAAPAWAEGPEDALPPDPGAEKIPKDQSWAYGTVGPEDLGDEEPYEGDVVCLEVELQAPKLRVEGLLMLHGGILTSEQKALRCADYKIAYKELRALYVLDLKLWAEKEQIYHHQLSKADGRIEKLEKAEDSVWNRYKFAVGLGLGFLLSTVLAVCTTVIVVKLK